MSGGGLATARLKHERKAWRKDHPPGFYARPEKNADGSRNIFKWICGVRVSFNRLNSFHYRTLILHLSFYAQVERGHLCPRETLFLVFRPAIAHGLCFFYEFIC